MIYPFMIYPFMIFPFMIYPFMIFSFMIYPFMIYPFMISLFWNFKTMLNFQYLKEIVVKEIFLNCYIIEGRLS